MILNRILGVGVCGRVEKWSLCLVYFEVYYVSCPGCECKGFMTDVSIDALEIQMNRAETKLLIQVLNLAY